MNPTDEHNVDLADAVQDLLNASFRADLRIWRSAADAGIMRAAYIAEKSGRRTHVGELAGAIGLPLPTAQRRVVRLIELGYLRKQRVSRRHLLEVTEFGLAKLNEHVSEISQNVKQLQAFNTGGMSDVDERKGANIRICNSGAA